MNQEYPYPGNPEEQEDFTQEVSTNSAGGITLTFNYQAKDESEIFYLSREEAVDLLFDLERSIAALDTE